MGSKWIMTFTLGLAGVAGLIMIPNRERFLLYFAVFILPIGLTFHPVYIIVPFTRPISGFQIRAFDIPFFLLMLFWMFRLVRDPREKIRFFPWMTIPYLMLSLFCYISLTQIAVHPAVKAGTLFLVIKNWLIFLYVANNLKDRCTVYFVIGMILLTGLIQAVIGMGQYAKGGPLGLELLGEQGVLTAKAGLATLSRVGGTIGHPNKLALFLTFILEINIALFFIPLSVFLRMASVFSLMLMTGALILTHSRGGWISLIIGGAINIYWCTAKKTRRKIASAILVFVVIGGGALGVVGLIEPVRNRVFEDDHGAGDVRIPLNRIALNIIRHHYWWGVGLNNYASKVREYDNSPEGVTRYFPEPVHNEYLLVAAELGIPAAVVFLILLGGVVILHISVVKAWEDPVLPFLTIGFFCGWIGWCLHHMFLFEYAFFSHNIWLYLGIVQALKTNFKLTEKAA
jgi:O-antigen ligase